MINSKITKQANQVNAEEKLFKLLESIDWKLWEIYNMMKKELESKNPPKVSKATKKVENEQ